MESCHGRVFTGNPDSDLKELRQVLATESTLPKTIPDKPLSSLAVTLVITIKKTVSFHPISVSFYPISLSFLPISVSFYPISVSFLPISVSFHLSSGILVITMKKTVSFHPISVSFHPISLSFHLSRGIHVITIKTTVSFHPISVAFHLSRGIQSRKQCHSPQYQCHSICRGGYM